MKITFIIIAAVIIVAVLLVFIIWRIRSRRFHPNGDKRQQQMDLNEDLSEAGFAYEIKGDYFYSLMNCWQREVGYCRLYDEAAPLFNMIMDCEPITFSCGGKRWLIELWKGQYGITTGGEIGIYNTDQADINTDKFKGVFYENIRNDERMNMSFVLRKNGRVILRRKDLHWWLTGFKLGEFSNPDSLTMDAKIAFPNREMRIAFVNALKKLGYGKREFSAGRRTVSIRYTKPHSKQAESRNPVQETVVQHTNSSNCKLYEFSTGKYSDTLDKLEYIKAMVPELYELFIESLYAKGIYEAFGWIKEWLKGQHPNPGPNPPEPPEPPCRPCPPEPPCPPCPLEPPCPPCPPEPPCRLCPPEPPCRLCPPEPPCRLCPPEPPCPPCSPEPPCRPCSPEPPCRPCPPEPPCPPCPPGPQCRPCPSEPPCKPCPPESSYQARTSYVPGSASSARRECRPESSCGGWTSCQNKVCPPHSSYHNCQSRCQDPCDLTGQPKAQENSYSSNAWEEERLYYRGGTGSENYPPEDLYSDGKSRQD